MTPLSPTSTEPAAGPPRVVLIGMMGAGKSVVGAMVASRLGCRHLDSDRQIEQRTGRTVGQIFADHGEAAFRAEEARALAEAAAVEGPLVISVAGGAVLSADNRRILRPAGVVVWLRADLATLAQRLQAPAGGDHRPLLAGDRQERLSVLYGTRRPFYEELADAVVDVDHVNPAEVADRVVAAWQAARVGVSRGA
jgi:shikimate kinase